MTKNSFNREPVTKKQLYAVLGSSSGNANDKGYFVDQAALETAYPIGQNGWFASIGSTDTIWIWDVEGGAWVNSGNAISLTNSWQDVSTTLATSQRALHNALNSLSDYESTYVDPIRGNDLTGNGSVAKPFSTIATAINSFNEGDPRVIYVKGSTTDDIVFRVNDASLIIVFDAKSQHSGPIQLQENNTSIYFLSPNGKATLSGDIEDNSHGNIYFDAILSGNYEKLGGSAGLEPAGYVEFSPNSNIDGLSLLLTGNTIVRTLGTGNMGLLTQDNGIFVGNHKGTMLCPIISSGETIFDGYPITVLKEGIQLLKNPANAGGPYQEDSLVCTAKVGKSYLIGVSTAQLDLINYGRLNFEGAGLGEGGSYECRVWVHCQLDNEGDLFPPDGPLLVNSAEYLNVRYEPMNYTVFGGSVLAHLQAIDAALVGSGGGLANSTFTESGNLTGNSSNNANSAIDIELLLPIGAEIGDVIEIYQTNAGKFKITQNELQRIIFGDSETTEGETGYLESTTIGDSITLKRIGEGDRYIVLSSFGNFNVV